MDICERANRQPGVRVYRRWWEQAGINLEGGNKRVAEAAMVSESESESEAELDLELDEDSGEEEEPKGSSGSSGAVWSGSEE